MLIAGAILAFWATFFHRDSLFYIGVFGVPAIVVLFIVATAFLVGDLLVPKSCRPAERCGISIALGLGIFGTVFSITLLLRQPFVPVFLTIAAAAWLSVFFHRRAFSVQIRSATPLAVVAACILSAGLAMALLAALAPPVSYDVLEYHLPLVRHWLTTNYLGAIDYNFYTFMPSGTETLFAIAAAINNNVGQPAKLMNFAILVSTALLVAALTRKMGASRTIALLAAAVFCTHNTTMRIYVDAFADMGAAMYAVASALALMLWRQYKSWWFIVLGGLLAGFAMGAKSSIAGIFIAPSLIAIGIALFVDWRQTRSPEGPRLAAWAPIVLYAIPLLLAFLPWSIRGYLLTGNPTSPFLNEWFGQDAWRIETEKLWLEMHGWTTPFSPGHWQTIVERIPMLGTAWVLGAMAGCFLLHGMGRAISFVAVFGFVIYGLLAAAPDRFAEPLIALMIPATMAAVSHPDLKPAWQKLLIMLLLGISASGLWRCAQNMAGSNNIEYAVSADRNWYLSQFMPTDLFHSTQYLPESSRTLVLYEARSQFLSGRNTCNTVFDRSPIIDVLRSSNEGSLARKLLANGYTHILVNELELLRLIGTHASPDTAAQPLYKQVQQIRNTERKADELVHHLEWYLPYERMKATPDELRQIQELTDRLAEVDQATFINMSGNQRLFLSKIVE